MWLVIDEHYRIFKAYVLTSSIKNAAKSGRLSIVNLETMKGMNRDGTWEDVQNWLAEDDQEIDQERCEHGAPHVKCDSCDLDPIDEQMIVDEDKYLPVRTIEDGYYHLYTPEEKEPTLAKLYINPDTQCEGFGFNLADGAGFLPASDITDQTTIIPVDITESARATSPPKPIKPLRPTTTVLTGIGRSGISNHPHVMKKK